jgi:hypothetical protein
MSKGRIDLSRQTSISSVLVQLNSKLMTWYFVKLFSNGLHFYPGHLRAMPIFKDLKESNAQFSEICDEIISKKYSGAESLSLEKKADEILYDLYSLTEDEKNLVRNS